MRAGPDVYYLVLLPHERFAGYCGVHRDTPLSFLMGQGRLDLVRSLGEGLDEDIEYFPTAEEAHDHARRAAALDIHAEIVQCTVGTAAEGAPSDALPLGWDVGVTHRAGFSALADWCAPCREAAPPAGDPGAPSVETVACLAEFFISRLNSNRLLPSFAAALRFHKVWLECEAFQQCEIIDSAPLPYDVVRVAGVETAEGDQSV